jgi:hypothetical protein
MSGTMVAKEEDYGSEYTEYAYATVFKYVTTKNSQAKY